MTDDSAFKKQVRARREQTGEKYTVARRMVIAGRDPGQPPVVLRASLNPHVDLELTGEAARVHAAADEPGRRDMANRLLADHLEMAGAEEAGVAAGSVIMTVQALRIEEIGEVVRRRIGRAAGVSAVAVGGDLDQVWVDIEAARPGVVHGHGGAGADRLRAELEELTGKPVQLNMVQGPGPRKGPGEAGSGRGGLGTEVLACRPMTPGSCRLQPRPEVPFLPRAACVPGSPRIDPDEAPKARQWSAQPAACPLSPLQLGENFPAASRARRARRAPGGAGRTGRGDVQRQQA